MKLTIKLICLSYIYILLASHALAASETMHHSLRMVRKVKKEKSNSQVNDDPVDIEEKSDLEMINVEDVLGNVESNIITGAPFAIILKKVKKFLPDCEKLNKKSEINESNKKKCEEKIKEADAKADEIRAKSIDDAAEIFANLKIKSVEEYWYWYYVLANVALRGKGKTGKDVGEAWTFEKKSEIKTTLKDYENAQAKADYQKLVTNSAVYSEKVKKCKNKTLIDLKGKINDNDIKYREWIGDQLRNTLELRDFEHNLPFIQLIKTTEFYKEIESKFPKGVIHHFHWAAGLSSNSINTVVSKYISDDSRAQSVLLRIDANYKDKTVKVGKNAAPSKYFERSAPKFVIIDDFTKISAEYIDPKNKELIEHFKTHTLKDGKCFDYRKPSETGQAALTELKGDLLYYTYLENCPSVFIYVNDKKKKAILPTPELLQKFEKKLLNLDVDFKKYLDTESNILKTNKELMESYLPDSYADQIKNYKEQLSAAVWYLFENIFVMIYPLFDKPEIFNGLDEIISDAWKNQNVLGVEYRQSNRPNQVKQMIKDLSENEKNGKKVLYAFQAPGTKSRGNRFNRMATIVWPTDDEVKALKEISGYKPLSDDEIRKKKFFEEKITKSAHYSGIDFFGYEDDPFNGARNFFPLSLQKILKNYEIKRNNNKIQLTQIDEVKAKKAEEETKKEEEEIKNDNLKSNEEILNQSNSVTAGNFSKKKDWFTPVYHTVEKTDLFLHAGETSFFPDHPVDDSFMNKYYINDNLIHAALLPNVKRVGHGFGVYRNDLIQAIYIKKNISLEICPMSNEALRYYYTFEHPFPKLLRKGIKMGISPDDPGFFGYEGVNVDWFKIFMETDLKPEETYLLVRDSIEKASDIMFGETEALAFTKKQEAIAKVADEIVKFYEGLNCSDVDVKSLQIDEKTKKARVELASAIHKALVTKVKSKSVYFQDKPEIDVETSVYNHHEIKNKISNSKAAPPAGAEAINKPTGSEVKAQPTKSGKVKRRLK
jgi:hypothetical protein